MFLGNSTWFTFILSWLVQFKEIFLGCTLFYKALSSSIVISAFILTDFFLKFHTDFQVLQIKLLNMIYLVKNFR